MGIFCWSISTEIVSLFDLCSLAIDLNFEFIYRISCTKIWCQTHFHPACEYLKKFSVRSILDASKFTLLSPSQICSHEVSLKVVTLYYIGNRNSESVKLSLALYIVLKTEIYYTTDFQMNTLENQFSTHLVVLFIS